MPRVNLSFPCPCELSDLLNVQYQIWFVLVPATRCINNTKPNVSVVVVVCSFMNG